MFALQSSNSSESSLGCTFSIRGVRTWFDRLKSISARQTFLTRPRVPPLDYTAIPLDTRIRFPFIPPPPRPRLRRSLLPCRRDLPNSLRSPIGVLELSIVLSSESESFQRSDTQRLGYELDPIPSYRCDGGTRRIRRRARANGNGHIILKCTSSLLAQFCTRKDVHGSKMCRRDRCTKRSRIA